MKNLDAYDFMDTSDPHDPLSKHDVWCQTASFFLKGSPHALIPLKLSLRRVNSSIGIFENPSPYSVLVVKYKCMNIDRTRLSMSLLWILYYDNCIGSKTCILKIVLKPLLYKWMTKMQKSISVLVDNDVYLLLLIDLQNRTDSYSVTGFHMGKFTKHWLIWLNQISGMIPLVI